VGYDGRGEVTYSSRASKDSQKPILRFTITIVVFVILLGSAGGYFSAAFDSVESTQATVAIQGYTASVINLHKNWIMQGRPKKVSIKGLNRQGEPGNEWIFIMNKDGWPINVIDGTEIPDCKALWYAMQKATGLAFSTTLRKMQLSDEGELEEVAYILQSDKQSKSVIWMCQNTVAHQLHFSYRLDTGKVEIEH
jgi:hypothetical protein